MKSKQKFWQKRMVGRVAAIHPFHKTPITVDPQKDAMISEDLDREMVRMPGLVSWYMALRDTAETAFKEARYHEHIMEEDIYAELRDQPRETTKKKLTETEMKMAVKRDTRMRDAYRARMNAEEMLRTLRSAVDTMIEKRWTLQSLTKWRLSERGVKDST